MVVLRGDSTPGEPWIQAEAIVGFSPGLALAVTATLTVEPLTIQEAASLEVGPVLQVLAVSEKWSGAS